MKPSTYVHALLHGCSCCSQSVSSLETRNHDVFMLPMNLVKMLQNLHGAVNIILTRQETFLSYAASRPDMGPIRLPIQRVP
jgi:hypothetical protein